MGEITDARDILAYKARGTDARDKLKQIRNLKQGKLDEKTTQGGNSIGTRGQWPYRLRSTRAMEN